jgi:predicted ATPase
MAYTQARIYLLGGDGICETRYEDTEHYILTRRFMVNPQPTLSAFLE